MTHLLTEDFSSDDESYELIDHPRSLESINSEETFTFSNDTLGAEVEVRSAPEGDDAFIDDILDVDDHPRRIVRFSQGPNGLFGMHHWGKLICSVEPQSPAEKQGLTRGDVILAIDGVNVETLPNDALDRRRLNDGGFSKMEVRFDPALLEAYDGMMKEIDDNEDCEISTDSASILSTPHESDVPEVCEARKSEFDDYPVYNGQGVESRRNLRLIEENRRYQEEITKKDEMIRQLKENEEDKNKVIDNLRELLDETEYQRTWEKARAEMLEEELDEELREKDAQLAQIHDTVKKQKERLDALLDQLNRAMGMLANSIPSGPLKPISVNLKAFNGKFLRARMSDAVDLAPHLGYNQWIVEDHGEQVAIRVNDNYDVRGASPKYLRALADGRVDVACSVEGASKWTPTKHEGGVWSFRSFNGRWLSARRTDGMMCTATENGKYECFELEYERRRKQCSAVQYSAALAKKEEEEHVNSIPPSPEPLDDILVNLKAFNGKYLCAGMSNAVDLAQHLGHRQWVIEDHGEQVAIRVIDYYNKRDISPKYLRAKTDGEVDVICAPESRWTPMKHEDGMWSFRSFYGGWLSAKSCWDGRMYTAEENGKTERFELEYERKGKQGRC